MPIEIFCCYARKDQQLLNELKAHLISLQRQGLIIMWADTDIGAGKEWAKEIEKHLDSADIVLLLVSVSFLSSDYCWGVEMTQALERHKAGKAIVIPIILRPCDWHTAPFARLQVLPERGRPVTDWRNRHDVFNDIALVIRQVASELAIEKRGIKIGSKYDPGNIQPLSAKMRKGKVAEKQFSNDPRDIFIEVLSIIDYEDDKEAYAAEFIDLLEKQALLDCLQVLPLEKQEAFKHQMTQATDQEQVKAIIAQYVSAEEYTQALTAASSRTFINFIESLIPELDDEQMDQLQIYLTSLSLNSLQLPLPVLNNPSSMASTEVQAVRPLTEQASPSLSSATMESKPLDSSNVPPGIAFVFIEKGKELGRIYEIDKTSLTVGREKTNDIILEDAVISRKHASLLSLGFGVYALRDEGSSNGTMLNDQLITAHQNYTLREGDRINFGQHQLIFTIKNGDDNEPTVRLKKTL